MRACRVSRVGAVRSGARGGAAAGVGVIIGYRLSRRARGRVGCRKWHRGKSERKSHFLRYGLCNIQYSIVETRISRCARARGRELVKRFRIGIVYEMADQDLATPQDYTRHATLDLQDRRFLAMP